MAKTDIIAETEPLAQVQHIIRKRQRSLLRQITTREEKIVALRAEQEKLRHELHHVAVEEMTAYACQGQNREGAA